MTELQLKFHDGNWRHWLEWNGLPGAAEMLPCHCGKEMKEHGGSDTIMTWFWPKTKVFKQNFDLTRHSTTRKANSFIRYDCSIGNRWIFTLLKIMAPLNCLPFKQENSKFVYSWIWDFIFSRELLFYCHISCEHHFLLVVGLMTSTTSLSF